MTLLSGERMYPLTIQYCVLQNYTSLFFTSPPFALATPCLASRFHTIHSSAFLCHGRSPQLQAFHFPRFSLHVYAVATLFNSHQFFSVHIYAVAALFWAVQYIASQFHRITVPIASIPILSLRHFSIPWQCDTFLINAIHFLSSLLLFCHPQMTTFTIQPLQ